MAYQRISNEKQVLILALLTEGTPINAICRVTKTGKDAVLRLIAEAGEAMNAYMMRTFTGLSCERIACDEQWQYVGCHGSRMARPEKNRGDFWLWVAMDSDTKLVIAHRIGDRKAQMAEDLMTDLAKRVVGTVQIATDALASYEFAIRGAFEGRATYGTETKTFVDAFKPEDWPRRRYWGIPKIAQAERKAVIGQPHMGLLTTAHTERLFLSIRQEMTRFTRATLGYSKCLRMHKLATGLHLAVYNLVRKHKGLAGKTPAQAAGVTDRAWTFEDVVSETQAYWQPRWEADRQEAARKRREAEDAMFAAALAGQ